MNILKLILLVLFWVSCRLMLCIWMVVWLFGVFVMVILNLCGRKENFGCRDDYCCRSFVYGCGLVILFVVVFVK